MAVAVPDSDLARGAVDLARSVEPLFLLEHSFRTFHLGGELLTLAGKSYDAEIMFVASMLHDIALGTEFDDGTTPFNLRGAGLAASHLVERGRSDHDAQMVFDAIALHMDVMTAHDERPEVAGVHLGAAADVIGLNVSDIPAASLEALLAEHPRLGMTAAFAEVIGTEASRKPYSDAWALIHNLGFIELIDAAPFEE